MICKIAAVLIVFTLAACPVLGQVAEIPAAPVSERPADADQTAVAEPYLPSLPVYTPAWTERWWVGSDYVMGFVKPVHLPPLVTTSPAGTPQAQAGVLGTDTSVLFGDRDADGDFRSGFRETVGCWFDQDRTLGCEAGFFWLTGLDQTYAASSNGSMILARPFTDATTGAPSSLLVAFPKGSGPTGTSSAGAIAIAANSGAFYGGHFDFEESLINDPTIRLKSLLGFRALRFGDSLDISQTMNPTSGVPAGTQISSQDNFSALNTFYGGEVGLQGEWILGPFAATFLGKVAIGALDREIGINGNTLITAPGTAPIISSGGLLALPTNSGTFSSNIFTVVPEAGLALSWNVTSNLRVTAGYSYMILFHAVRAAEQIDTTVNTSLLNSSLTTVVNSGGALRPAFMLQQSDVWVQTINVGLEFRY